MAASGSMGDLGLGNVMFPGSPTLLGSTSALSWLRDRIRDDYLICLPKHSGSLKDSSTRADICGSKVSWLFLSDSSGWKPELTREKYGPPPVGWLTLFCSKAWAAPLALIC